MNPLINDGGLQLGASCCNRPLDWFGPRDIDGGVPISVLGMSTTSHNKTRLDSCGWLSRNVRRRYTSERCRQGQRRRAAHRQAWPYRKGTDGSCPLLVNQ